MNIPRSRGFTLIELMMAVAVAAVLLALAGPSFQQALNGSRLSSAASELTAAVQLARSEAIRNNRRVTLCRSTDGSACNTTSSDWTGWIMFVDSNIDGVRNAAEPLLKAGSIDTPVRVLASAAVTALGERITFRGDGTARAADGQTLLVGTLAVCVPSAMPPENVREVSIASGSRTTVRRRNGAGVCNTPNNA